MGYEPKALTSEAEIPAGIVQSAHHLIGDRVGPTFPYSLEFVEGM
jgi:hypothetical protein